MGRSQLRSKPAVAAPLFVLLFLLAVAPSLPGHGHRGLVDGASSGDTAGAASLDSYVVCDPTDTECEEEESWGLLTLLVILVLCILVTYALLVRQITFLPESVVVILIGLVGGLLMRFTSLQDDFERLHPDTFFLILLPPIIFESGYSLHKGNFFRNLGSIALFAVFGTIISTVIVGFLIYLVGVMGWSYGLPLIDCLIFGSLISAVDPVATLAVFHALDVNPTLNMLVFGESVVNDAVAIVLYHTLIKFVRDDVVFNTATLFAVLGDFLLVSLGSVVIGILSGLLSAFLLKKMTMNKFGSLELGFMFLFAYIPYLVADGLGLSGIMAILFNGIVMAHYTYFNLSPKTQISTQQVFRVLAFMAETCIFGYLGMAVFAFPHSFQFSLVLWSIVLILVGRAANIFPLSALTNRKRTTKIPGSYQVVMWFSGLRGAIAFALALKVPTASKPVLFTTTLVIVLFTIFVFGGGTLPLLKLMKVQSKKSVTMSKTEDLDHTVALVDDDDGAPSTARTRSSRRRRAEAEAEEEHGVNTLPVYELNWFEKIDNRYLKPTFRTIYTRASARAAQKELRRITNTWYRDLRGSVDRGQAMVGLPSGTSSSSSTPGSADGLSASGVGPRPTASVGQRRSASSESYKAERAKVVERIHQERIRYRSYRLLARGGPLPSDDRQGEPSGAEANTGTTPDKIAGDGVDVADAWPVADRENQAGLDNVSVV